MFPAVILAIANAAYSGNLHPWKSAATLTPLIVGLLTLITFGFYEAYANLAEPLLPPRLFREFRQFTLPILVVCVVGMQW
jgi:hypothetical protein